MIIRAPRSICGCAEEPALIETGDEYAISQQANYSRGGARKSVPEADYHLAFADAARLLAELPPKRVQTLRAVQPTGATSIYALAKRLKRNYSNVHTDVRRLTDLGLLEKDAAGHVFVPSEDVIVKIDASLLKAA